MGHRQTRNNPERKMVCKTWKEASRLVPGWWKAKKECIAIHPGWKGVFEKEGLTTLDTLSGLQGDKCMREVPSRQTVRLNLGGKILYLKKYLEPSRGKSPEEQVAREFSNLIALKTHGLHCPEPVMVAAGYVKETPVGFLVTLEIKDGVQADHLLGHTSGRNAKYFLEPEERRKLILEGIGKVAGRLHRAGWVHRDLYLCHFFPVFEQDGGLRVYLIDLQRMFRPPRTRFPRWRLKDLAALYYSCVEFHLRQDEMRYIWNAYFDTAKLPRWSKPLWIRAAGLKALWVARHDRRIQKRKVH